MNIESSQEDIYPNSDAKALPSGGKERPAPTRGKIVVLDFIQIAWYITEDDVHLDAGIVTPLGTINLAHSELSSSNPTDAARIKAPEKR